MTSIVSSYSLAAKTSLSVGGILRSVPQVTRFYEEAMAEVQKLGNLVDFAYLTLQGAYRGERRLVVARRG